MSRRLRPAAVAACAAMTLGLVAACGAGGETPPDNIAAGAEEAPVTPPADLPESGAADAADGSGGSAAEDPATSGIAPAPGVTPEAPTAPKAFQFAGTTIGGEEFEGADLAGRPTVFWFWAPWCSTCRSQISQVQALTSAYDDTEVAFVGVGSLDDASAMKPFADDIGAPGMTQLSDPEGLVWRHFGTTAQSTFLVIDGQGRRIDSGYMSEADLNAAIKSALAGSPA